MADTTLLWDAPARLNPVSAFRGEDQTIADTVRQIKRDAADLSEQQKAQARRAAREFKNLGILLDELGI